MGEITKLSLLDLVQPSQNSGPVRVGSTDRTTLSLSLLSRALGLALDSAGYRVARGVAASPRPAPAVSAAVAWGKRIPTRRSPSPPEGFGDRSLSRSRATPLPRVRVWVSPPCSSSPAGVLAMARRRVSPPVPPWCAVPEPLLPCAPSIGCAGTASPPRSYGHGRQVNFVFLHSLYPLLALLADTHARMPLWLRIWMSR